MPDVDTGLGWYADQDWLSSISGSIGSYSKGTEIEPLPIFGKILTAIVDYTVGYAKNSSNSDCSFKVTSPSSAVYCSMLISGSTIQMILSSQQPFNVIGYEGGAQTFSTAATTPFLGTTSYGVTWSHTSGYTPTWGASSRYNTADGDTALSVVNEQRAPKVYLAEKNQSYSILLLGNRWKDFNVSSASKPVYFSVAYYYENGAWCCGLTASSEASFSATYAGSTMSVTKPSPYGYDDYGFTYYFSGVSGSSYYINGAVHAYDSKITGAYDVHQAVIGAGGHVTVNYAKASAGYSVVCMCKWITSYGGDVYFSPVLISSEPNNTLFTRDGSTPSVNNTEHQYQGATFYMRKAPLDTLTGGEEITSTFPIADLSGVAQTNDTIFAAIAYQSGLTVGYIPSDDDPYAPGGTSGPSSGTPDFTEVSESISPGSTFPISFQSTGLCRVYVPSITDLNDLANYLWTDQTFLDTIKNILINQFENFMEAVISLTMVPCQVPAGAAQAVKVMFLPTGLSFPPATQQFVEVDCGYVDITERYASALDYNPYTKVSLYLPFIGTVPLDTDEVMGHRVKCVYTIDIVSGACVAKIMVDYPDSSNGVLYQFSGHCSISMPLTAADFSSYYAAAMSGLKMAAGLAAAGAGAPGLAGSLLGEPTAHPSSTTTTTRTTQRNAATGRQILTGTESRETSHTPGQASFKELATRASVNTVGAVINSKFSVEHSGGFTGNTGFLGVQAPYVIITRPDMCNPDEYGAYNGRPSMMYLYLGNLSGFTQVQNIKLTGIPATNPELGEIAELLKTGVIL